MITKEQCQELRQQAENTSRVTPEAFIALLDHLESALAVIGGWSPIDTAPKDGGEILLFYPAGAFQRELIEKGWWCDDRYAAKPKPYWTHSSERMWGIKRCRDNPPTHWMPLPLSPRSDEVGKHV